MQSTLSSDQSSTRRASTQHYSTMHRSRLDLPASNPNSDDIADRYVSIRRQTENLCAPLQDDDFNLQGMAETSPPKWHLAHTTWFFETFVLASFLKSYEVYHPKFATLFNSYYNGFDEAPYPRPQRGLLSRPTIAEVFSYRRFVDFKIIELLRSDNAHHDGLLDRIELGMQHEQQHQELLLMDIKYSFSLNPLLPTYCANRDFDNAVTEQRRLPEPRWKQFVGGLYEIGADKSSFYFDNEAPRHREFLSAYTLADRLITNAEYLDFIEDGGYERPELWLADGWRECKQRQWSAPLYWNRQNDTWRIFTLRGETSLTLNEPVSHISYYEADAYARWSGARLPTETEWENAAHHQLVQGNFIESESFHPLPASQDSAGIQQLFGDLWEWTASPYVAYPGYKMPRGTIGEYNGKFMCNQMVLRGGSCLSPRQHLRASYRNFFYPIDRWQFSGLRLAH